MIGEYRPVLPKAVKVGDVIYCSSAPYAVIQRQARPGKGPHLLLEQLDTRRRKEMWCRTDTKVFRLHVPRQASGPAKDWAMARGDVVVYPDVHIARTVAAIRHGAGWHTTSGVRIPRPDVQVLMDVIEGRAVIVRRTHLSRPDLVMVPPYRSGSVIAVEDPAVVDPTVLVRTGPDLWRSSTGVEVSDAMIKFEMTRQTYRLLWAPGR